MQPFPLLHDRFEHQFGVRALAAAQSIVEVSDEYHREITLKRQLLDDDPPNYVQALRGSEAACGEAAALLRAAATFIRDGRNCLTGESLEGPQTAPLLTIARHVQEDVAILSGDAARGHPLVAGVVCFPSGWSIRDKIGKSVLQIHEPVPEYAAVLGRSTDRLLQQLKPSRPVFRLNWGVRAGGELDQSPKHAARMQAEAGQLAPHNVGCRCYFRVERQTLSRLEASNGILFTIHTQQTPLERLEGWQKRNLLGVLESCPPATLQYKGISPIQSLVCDYLRRSDSC